ncbi:hypothetical protein AI2905V1_1126, partial [Enterobacter cloacae]
LTTLLVFTRNFAMRQAIQGLSSADKAVFFFDNRLEFIVCATILDKPCILIDAIDETTDNIRWLYSRLAARGLSRRTYFISPEENTGNSYLKLFWLVTTIKELKALCDRAAKLPATEKPWEVADVIYDRLSVKLSPEHLDFLMTLYDASTGKYRCNDRDDINKNYYLRKRLALGSSSEMKQLIVILSTQAYHHPCLKSA